jgi:hypothetical protein
MKYVVLSELPQFDAFLADNLKLLQKTYDSIGH